MALINTPILDDELSILVEVTLKSCVIVVG